MALSEMEKIHRKLILRMTMKIIKNHAQRKTIAIEKICKLMIHWNECRKKIKLMDRYMNHCASIIQGRYSNRNSRKSSPNLKVIDNKDSVRRKNHSIMQQNKNSINNGKFSNSPNKKGFEQMLNAKTSFTKAYNKFINRKDDSGSTLKKSKINSARRQNESEKYQNPRGSIQSS